jgi:hypothetical protein
MRVRAVYRGCSVLRQGSALRGRRDTFRRPIRGVLPYRNGNRKRKIRRVYACSEWVTRHSETGLGWGEADSWREQRFRPAIRSSWSGNSLID